MVGIGLNPYDDDFVLCDYWYVNHECCIATSAAVLSLGRSLRGCWASLRVLLEHVCYECSDQLVSYELRVLLRKATSELTYAIYKYNVICWVLRNGEYYAYGRLRFQCCVKLRMKLRATALRYVQSSKDSTSTRVSAVKPRVNYAT
jgi:hypothetical protein